MTAGKGIAKREATEIERSSVELQLAKMTQALANVQTFDDIIKVRSAAEALRLYAKAAFVGLQAVNEASRIKLMAERQAGLALDSIKREPGKRTDTPDTSLVSGGTEYRQVLNENHIGDMTANRWQQEAKVADGDFDAFVALIQESGQELTQAGLLAVYKKGLDAAIEKYVMSAPEKIGGAIDVGYKGLDKAVSVAKQYAKKEKGKVSKASRDRAIQLGKLWILFGETGGGESE